MTHHQWMCHCSLQNLVYNVVYTCINLLPDVSSHPECFCRTWKTIKARRNGWLCCLGHLWEVICNLSSRHDDCLSTMERDVCEWVFIASFFLVLFFPSSSFLLSSSEHLYDNNSDSMYLMWQKAKRTWDGD